MPDGETIIMALIVLFGSGIFLRLLARQKHRREREVGCEFTESSDIRPR